MSTVRLGLANGYPSRIPNSQAAIYLESGAAGLPTNAMNGDRLAYNFEDEIWVSQKPRSRKLYRSSSNNALTAFNAQSSLLAPAVIPARSATPQPRKPPKDVQIKITEAMRAEVLKFTQLVAQYNGKIRDPKDKLNFGDCRSFDDLAAELGRLQNYYEKAKDTKSDFLRRLRQCTRDTADASDAVNSWLRLLPGDSKELSVLVGGISIVFDASARLDQLRKETYKILAKIPILLRRATKYMDYYAGTGELTRFVSGLYVAVLSALGKIMQWYATSSTRKAFEAVLKGDGYRRDMQESFIELEDAAQEVWHEAELAQHEAGFQFQTRSYEYQDESRTTLTSAYNSMQQLLFENEIAKDLQYQKSMLAAHRRREYQKDQRDRRNHILTAVNYDRDNLDSDRDTILYHCLAMEKRHRDFAASILQQEEIKSWMTSPRSSALTVNANDDDETISSVSMATVLLLGALDRQSAKIIAMYWFCGIHTDSTAPYDMIVSMIGQLCQSQAFSVNLQETWSELLDSLQMYVHQTRALLEVLAMLLKAQLRASPVYVLIDSASFYESRAMYANARPLFELLLDMVNLRSYKSHALKVLLTSPQSCTRLTESLQADQVLEMDTFDLMEDDGYQSDEYNDY